MDYLAAEQVLFIHARLISETGGMHGVHDLGLLLSAVARPQATFAPLSPHQERVGEYAGGRVHGQDLYLDLFSKAAALLESLIGKHAFVDGNIRTAITSTGLFLRINGYRLTANNQQLEAFSLQCAQHSVSLDEIARWLESLSERIT